MLLTDSEVECYINKITSKQNIVVIDKIWLVFQHPSNLIKQKADVIYSYEYEKALEEGLLDHKSLEELITKRRLFTSEDQEKLDKLNNKRKAQQVLLAKTTVVKANQDRVKKIIHSLDEEIRKLSFKKTSMLTMSAEVKANEEKTLFLCWSSIYDELGTSKYWSTFDDFKNTTDLFFRDKVLSKFIEFYGGSPNDVIRYIARHNLWRIRYVNSQKTSEQLFGVPTVEYTNDMLSLAYWSNYYDNIYQMMPEDRPSDLIIEDDEALDAYMKSYYEERNRQDASRRSTKRSPGKLSAFDSEEVIVTASNELYQDIKYDKPREAQRLKDLTDIKKKANSKARIGTFK